jgi:hypothetical protein
LLVKVFAPKKYRIKIARKRYFVCQNCGYYWEF